jgi:hypothetical protein
MKKKLMIFAIIWLTALLIGSSPSVSADFFDCVVNIKPENPTILDEVKVYVNFLFRTHPPFVQDFGLISKDGNSFSVTVTILVPRKDEVCLQILHTANFTYSLGKLDIGNYTFNLYVKTVHGSEGYWLEKRIDFSVTSSENVMPEFSSTFVLLLMFMLTLLSFFIIKTQKRFLSQKL